MKRDFLNKILYTVMCMFLITAVVLAEPTYQTGNGETGNGGSGNKSALRYKTRGDGNYVMGIRVLFYRSDGTKIKSQDYVAPLYAKSTLYTQYGDGQPCGKVDHCSYGSWSVSHSVLSNDVFTQAFSSSGMFGTNIETITRNGDLSKDVLFSEVINASDAAGDAKSLFANLGIIADNYYDSSKSSYDLFLVWEPLGLIEYNGNLYLGTAYELINYVDTIPGSFTSSSGTYDAWTLMSKALTQNMGCSVNLDNSDYFGLSVASKFNTFTARSYFNGKLDANTASVFPTKSTCKTLSATQTLKPLGLNNSSAFAIGILWFDDIVTDRIGCYDVQTFYGKYTIENAIRETGTFDFSQFNKLNKGREFPAGFENGITTEWYKNYCMDDGPDEEKFNCITGYNVPNCSVGAAKTLVYKDTENWDKCVFTDKDTSYNISTHKTSEGTSLTYRDTSLGSKYCPVYCIESVYGNFDSNEPLVLAGSKFQWGWSTVNTTRTCRTKTIDWNQFDKDLKTANKDILQQYAQELLYKAYSDSKWTKGTDRYKNGDICTSPITDENGNQTGCAGWNQVYDCTNYSYKDSKTVTGGGQSAKAEIDTSVCQASAPKKNPVDNGNVSGAVSHMNSVVKNMEACYTFITPENQSKVLNDESEAIITYNSPIYQYSDDMKKDNSTSYSDVENCTNATVYTLTSCSGNSCSGTTTMSKCTSYEATGVSNTTFSVKDGVYQYVLKNPNSLALQSVHKPESDDNLPKSTNFTLNWIDVGYSNFPVPYDLDAGYTGTISIKYSNIGHKKSGNTTTDVDTILGSLTSSDSKAPYYVYGTYSDWTCKYIVDKEPDDDCIPSEENNNCCKPGDPYYPTCEGPYDIGGIRVIYREIDLYYPFPDTDAKYPRFRSTGANWCDRDSCAWNNQVSTKAILKNRNVTSDDLYDLDPMYVFEMTPTDILEIRRYNNSYDNEYSKYTGQSGANYYDFTCIKGTGRGCRSEYLTHLLDILDSDKFPGTCKNDRQVYQTEEQFEKCRY